MLVSKKFANMKTNKILISVIFFLLTICSLAQDTVLYKHIRVGGKTWIESFSKEWTTNSRNVRSLSLFPTDEAMNYGFAFRDSSNCIFIAGKDTLVISKFGQRTYHVDGQFIKVDGYITLDPSIDGSLGVFYNENLGIIHLVAYQWGNYMYLSDCKKVSKNFLDSVNHFLMNDSTFYFYHRYPLLPPSPK